MTISESLKLAIIKLRNSRVTNNSHLEAEILLSEILKKQREFLLAHGEKKLSAGQMAKFKSQISMRLKGMPIAYITGRKEFYGLNFKVNKNVLIPRPETELIVDEALNLAAHCPGRITFMDIGTGSGCVIVSLLKNCNDKFQISNFKFLATDISPRALSMAEKNAKYHKATKRIKFIKSDLLASIIRDSSFMIHDSLIILANLPYLTKKQIKNSPSIEHEPKIALYAGKDGLELYKKLFKQTKKIPAAYILCEFDPRQTAKIKQLIKRELPEATLQIKKDLDGLNRLVIIKLLGS